MDLNLFSPLLLVLLKWPIFIPLLALAIYFIFRNSRLTQKTAEKFFAKFEVGGHRGSPRIRPENTMASMDQAKSEGADLIEFDVSLTKDGVAVLLHDDTLDRTTNFNGPIRNVLFKDLATCNCAAKFEPENKTEKNNDEKLNLPIPTLEELVKWAKTNQMRMLFDVKDADLSLVLILEQLFEKYDIYDSGIVCSFFPTVVYRIKKHQPKILTGLTWRRWFLSYQDLEAVVPRSQGPRLLFSLLLDVLYLWSIYTWLPSFLGVDMVLTERREISSAFVNQQAAEGRRVCAWTVNDLREMQWMRNVLKIPVLTDVPALISQL